ncbi:MAG: hypothetical protein LBU80_03580 [Rikenellaceae bacterium]|jgi:hypothetical protein|nr:hypothetical protein [Rikenellaceae bacterium]
MRKFLLTLALCAATYGAQAQQRSESHSAFYAEVGGAGFIFSANFDSRFHPGERLGWGYRAGLGFGTFYGGSSDEYYYEENLRSFATFPLGLNYIFGKPDSDHTFLAGCGITVMTQTVSAYNWDNDLARSGNVIGHFEFMYRRQPRQGGFMWQIGPAMMIGTGGDIVPSGAIALGYAF